MVASDEREICFCRKSSMWESRLDKLLDIISIKVQSMNVIENDEFGILYFKHVS